MNKIDFRKYTSDQLKTQVIVMKPGAMFDAIIKELWRRRKHEMVLSGLAIV